MSVKFSFLLLSASFLGACIQSAGSQMEPQVTHSGAVPCEAMFSAFTELSPHTPKTYLGYNIPEQLKEIEGLVDLDGDGDLDRILVAHYGRDTDITDGPYTVIVVIGDKNPAYTSLDKESATALFRPSNIQSSAEHDFQYLSFDHFLYRFKIPNAKGVHEAWAPLQYQQYFKSLDFPQQLTLGAPITLRPTLARVGYINDRAFLLLSAKPIEYDESRTSVIGYDSEGKYIGRRFEFLATYKGGRELELNCARLVQP